VRIEAHRRMMSSAGAGMEHGTRGATAATNTSRPGASGTGLGPPCGLTRRGNRHLFHFLKIIYIIEFKSYFNSKYFI